MVDIALNEHFIPIFVNTSPDPSFHSSESFYLLCGGVAVVTTHGISLLACHLPRRKKF